MLNKLPPEIIGEIASYLSFNDQNALLQVSKNIHEFFSRPNRNHKEFTDFERSAKGLKFIILLNELPEKEVILLMAKHERFATMVLKVPGEFQRLLDTCYKDDDLEAYSSEKEAIRELFNPLEATLKKLFDSKCEEAGQALINLYEKGLKVEIYQPGYTSEKIIGKNTTEAKKIKEAPEKFKQDKLLKEEELDTKMPSHGIFKG